MIKKYTGCLVEFGCVVGCLVSASLVVSFNAVAQSYPVCQSASSDPDGDSYGWENNTTCRVQDSDTAPVIVRRDNGSTVNQVRAYWQASDLVGKSIDCQNYLFSSDPVDPNAGVYITDPFNPEFNHSADGTVTQVVNGQFAGSSQWSISDGVYTGVAFISGTKFVDADYLANSPQNSRGWINANSFWECRGAAPTAAPSAPLATCIDTPPAGDGWGWDGVSSCQISNATVCVDTDPTGDGWGWDGVQSCRIAADPAPDAVCVDTPPAGDGWGWDGATSCQTGHAVAGLCEDTDPVGDGWGWDGVSSCRI